MKLNKSKTPIVKINKTLHANAGNFKFNFGIDMKHLQNAPNVVSTSSTTSDDDETITSDDTTSNTTVA